ncbi:MAG: hypothetical protein FE045_01080 [Thermoplasmata archaeon]|nr:MAG: hypothetical protein FE045_01080 [Thermoplasmata archaeon]
MKKVVLAIITIILLFPSLNYGKSEDIVYKRIAVYPSIVPAVKVLETSLKYGWHANGKTYVFLVNEISQKDILLGKLRNYDALVIGASGRQYLYGIDKLWKERVRQFIASGGGYLGICGGANEASMGYEKPSNAMDYLINKAVLRIANVYINDDQDQEWQYLYKTAGIEGGVPIECRLLRHPIFEAYPNDTRIIRYEGGPGMYPANANDKLLGEIEPIAIYNEEPSEKAPLHHWYKKWGKWYMDGNITTDIKGQYAGIATTYGKGRIVLFGPHPEEITMIGGHVEEFPGRSKYTLFREKYLYRWTGGNYTSWGYNWWIVRRSMAWICGIDDMPSINDVVTIFRVPNNFMHMLYIDGRMIMPVPQNIVIGSINIQAFVSNAEHVSFYVDGKLVKDVSSPPYTWKANLKGKHEIMIKAFDGNSFAYDEIEAYFI